MNKNIRDDIKQLCAEILSTKTRFESYHLYGHAIIPISREKATNAFLYSEKETPYYLDKLGIISIMDQRLILADATDNDLKTSGYLSVEFNFLSAQNWLKKETTSSIKVPDGWQWYNKKNAEYQFGDKGIFKQTGKIVNKKVFIALMDLYMESPQGISVVSIYNRTQNKIPKHRIRKAINDISDRLSKIIEIYFKSNNDGFYRIYDGIKIKKSKNDINK